MGGNHVPVGWKLFGECFKLALLTFASLQEDVVVLLRADNAAEGWTGM